MNLAASKYDCNECYTVPGAVEYVMHNVTTGYHQNVQKLPYVHCTVMREILNISVVFFNLLAQNLIPADCMWTLYGSSSSSSNKNISTVVHVCNQSCTYRRNWLL